MEMSEVTVSRGDSKGGILEGSYLSTELREVEHTEGVRKDFLSESGEERHFLSRLSEGWN